ncbi:MAG: ferrous iron transport protein A [Flavobacteriales bacterium]|jgi:ferrous iron transport protein A
MVPLSTLHKGQTATIVEVLNQEESMKLMEMGCLPGERITLENIAPLGDPLAITVAGYKLSLRKSDAEKLLVSDVVG